MKSMPLFLLFAWICLLVSPSAGLADDRVLRKGPIAHVSEPNYTFPIVVDGMSVRHDFVIRNTGTATLEIEKVKTG